VTLPARQFSSVGGTGRRTGLSSSSPPRTLPAPTRSSRPRSIRCSATTRCCRVEGARRGNRTIRSLASRRGQLPHRRRPTELRTYACSAGAAGRGHDHSGQFESAVTGLACPQAQGPRRPGGPADLASSTSSRRPHDRGRSRRRRGTTRRTPTGCANRQAGDRVSSSAVHDTKRCSS